MQKLSILNSIKIFKWTWFKKWNGGNSIPILLFLIMHGSLSEKLFLPLYSMSPPKEGNQCSFPWFITSAYWLSKASTMAFSISATTCCHFFQKKKNQTHSSIFCASHSITRWESRNKNSSAKICHFNMSNNIFYKKKQPWDRYFAYRRDQKMKMEMDSI